MCEFITRVFRVYEEGGGDLKLDSFMNDVLWHIKNEANLLS